MIPDPETQPQFYDGVPTKRLLAWIVDVALIATLTVIAVPLTAFIGLFFLPVIFLILSFAYRVITLARGSATWGMRLFSLEMRTNEDQPFDVAHAFFHTLGYALSWAMPLVQLVSVVMMLSSQRRQSLPDMVLGTVGLNCRG